MLYVSRKDWKPSTGLVSPADPLPAALGVKVHWIGGEYTTPTHDQCAAEVRGILAEHLANKEQKWVDIAYNFLVCGHGFVFEGRGVGKRSGANGNKQLNTDDYAVCAIVGIHEQDSPELLYGLRDAIGLLRDNGAGLRLAGHCDGYPTDCPGPFLYQWVHQGGPYPGGPPPTAWPFPAGQFFHLTAKPYQRDDRLRPWQRELIAKGYNLGPTGDDGIFGPLTAKALEELQAAAFTDPREHDGWLGPKSWRAAWTVKSR